MKKGFNINKMLDISILRILFLSGFMTGLSSAAVPYEAVELGTLGHSDIWSTESRGINDAGQVVGWSKTANGKKHAFLWQNGVMTDLGTFGGDESAAYAINEKGQVTGWSTFSNGQKRSFIWDRTNGMQNLGIINMYSSDCINESGQVIGWDTNAVMWDPQLGLVKPWSSTSFIGYGINDMGQIAGAIDSSSMPVIWDKGKFTDLGTLGGQGAWSARAIAINNAGQVVGYSTTSTNTVNPFLWDKQNGMVNLIGITGETGWAFAINENGQVVGGSHVDNTSHVFLWDSVNGIVDLSSQLNLEGYLQGWDVNNKGQIVAGRYLLSPIPEPCTLSLLALGAILAGRKSRV